jgi:hypothetical protein
LDSAELDPQMALNTEKWEPYVRWKIRLLLRGDAVITFNWDRVLDILGCKGSNDLVSMLPGMVAPTSSSIPVFHLHGHVSWQKGANEPTRVCMDEDHLASVKRPELAVLGTPGGTKKRTSETVLLSIWQEAMLKLRAAETVVFIGYRFPPSDNMSKRSLLDALKVSNVDRVHVVLGPRSQDAARLTGLLNWTDHEDGQKRAITVHEMGAEDFLSVVERRHL